MVFVTFQELDLSHNKISQIHPTALKGLNALETLDIGVNRLTVAPSIVGVKATLKYFDLRWNYIKHISDTYFDSCRNIMHINLAVNLLTDIPNVRNISRTLRYISLEANNISSAQPIYGIQFPKLHLLHLMKNQIRSFCFPPLTFVPRVRKVYISLNNLSRIHLPQNYMRPSETILLDLADNPWNCNDSLGWTQHCTAESHLTMMCMGWLEVKGMVCSSPQNVQGLTPKEAGTAQYIS